MILDVVSNSFSVAQFYYIEFFADNNYFRYAQQHYFKAWKWLRKKILSNKLYCFSLTKDCPLWIIPTQYNTHMKIYICWTG